MPGIERLIRNPHLGVINTLVGLTDNQIEAIFSNDDIKNGGLFENEVKLADFKASINLLRQEKEEDEDLKTFLEKCDRALDRDRNVEDAAYDILEKLDEDNFASNFGAQVDGIVSLNPPNPPNPPNPSNVNQSNPQNVPNQSPNQSNPQNDPNQDFVPPPPPDPPPLTAEQRYNRFKKASTTPEPLKEKMKEMEEMLKSPDSSVARKELAAGFFRKVVQLSDNIEKKQKEFDDTFNENVEKFQKRPIDSAHLFKESKKNNKEYKTNIKRLTEVQTLTHEALYQGAKKILKTKENKLDRLNVDNLVVPNVKEKNHKSKKRKARDSITEEVFEEDNIDMLAWLRATSGYSKSKDSKKIMKQVKENKQEAWRESYGKSIASNKDCFTTPAMRSAYLEIMEYEKLQKAQWQKDNQGKDPTTEDSKKEISKIRLADMDSIKLGEINFKNMGGGLFQPDHLTPISTDGGISTHAPTQLDMTISMVKLLTAMQAEGKTQFEMSSSFKPSREAFRAAARVCNIPPEQIIIRAGRKHKHMHSDRTDITNSKVGFFSLKEKNLARKAQKVYDKTQLKSLGKQKTTIINKLKAEKLAKKKEQNVNQEPQDQQEEQRNPGIGMGNN